MVCGSGLGDITVPTSLNTLEHVAAPYGVVAVGAVALMANLMHMVEEARP